jgi:hypothetical protein|tara:strand:+ start:26337 stop:26720 length:384 start_codon:yes stop_codon:yes gene_type:complete
MTTACQIELLELGVKLGEFLAHLDEISDIETRGERSQGLGIGTLGSDDKKFHFRMIQNKSIALRSLERSMITAKKECKDIDFSSLDWGMDEIKAIIQSGELDEAGEAGWNRLREFIGKLEDDIGGRD